MPRALPAAFHERLVASLGLRGAIGGLAIGLGCAGGAAADAIPPCAVLPPVTDIDVADAPRVLQFAMTRDIGHFARPGEAFDATDVIQTGVNRRLIWVRRRDTRWVVAFEQGGRAYHDQVISYEVGYDGSVAGMRSEVAFPSTVCQVTERALWR